MHSPRTINSLAPGICVMASIATHWRETRSLPAFADSTRLRLVLGTLLYLAQGIPQGIFFGAIPTWLAANGQSTEVVAMAAAAASLPWSFKFLAGLFMDRYTWLPMGRRRPWLVGSQSAIFIVLMIAAIASPLPSQTVLVIGFVLALSVLTAILDVALDALAVDLTPESEMGRMNSFMFAGKVFGIAGGMASTSYLLEYHGFSVAMIGMAACFALPSLAGIVIRERAGEKLLPWTRGSQSPDLNIEDENWAAILSATLRNLIRPQSLIVVCILLTYGIHQNLNDTTASLFAIRELGWNQSQYSSMIASLNIAVGIFCFTVGGWLVDRFGPKRIAFLSGCAALPIMAGYMAEPALWEDDRLFIAWAALKTVPLFLFYLANLVMAMRVTAKKAAATSFAVFMGLGTLGFTIASAILPTLENLGGFQAMFGVSAVLVFVAGMLALFLAEQPKQQNAF
ncbi:MAG: MFS transporter [Pseudomonadota bacterium]